MLAKLGPDKDVDEGIDGAVEEEENGKDGTTLKVGRLRYDPRNEAYVIENVER